MYDWDLGELGTPPVLGPELPEIHRTRLDMIEAPVRTAFEQAGPAPTAIDLGSAEGWFAHRLLEWGAARVVAVDMRAENIERARLVRDHLGVPADRLELVQADLFDLDTDALGEFDVVLALSLIYHLENPTGALRVARRLTRRVCLLDLQLTRPGDDAQFGVGSTGIVRSSPASFAAVLDPSASENYIGGAVGAVNMLPNRAAAELTARAAGFGEVEWRRARDHHNPQYVQGDRAVMAAYPGRPPDQRDVLAEVARPAGPDPPQRRHAVRQRRRDRHRLRPPGARRGEGHRARAGAGRQASWRTSSRAWICPAATAGSRGCCVSAWRRSGSPPAT